MAGLPSGSDPRTRSTEAAWEVAAKKYALEVEADAAFVREGLSSLTDHECRILGDLSWCERAVHLQCSHGLDALSLLNMGVSEVVGIDLSRAMLAQAQAKTDLLQARATWVHADVLDPPVSLRGTADLVYTGKGAICWIRDIERWAAAVAGLLRPGGRLFVHEGHPLNWIWEAQSSSHRLSRRSYFDRGPYANDGFPAAAVERYTPPGEAVPTAWEYQWTLGQIVTALAAAGIHILRLEEHPEIWWPQFPHISPGEFVRLPHMFSLFAAKP